MALVEHCAPWLDGKAHSIHSQFGEDGLIAAIFDRIDITNKWCFEVGAGDGITGSNTKVLRDDRWNAILIEASAERYAALEAYADDRVTTAFATVDAHILEDLLGANGAPADLDFGCIDIDGQDYWVWAGLSRFQPRVMMVEFSPCVASPDFIPDVGADGRNGKCQAGLNAVRMLGREKGYVEVAKTQVNLLFVRGDQL